MRRGVRALVAALLMASSAAHAVGGVAVLASLPPIPMQIGDEKDCQTLAEASTAFRAQAHQVREQLDAEAAAAQQAFQQQMALGKTQMDMTQAMQYAQYTQETRALDPDSHYCRSKYLPDDTSAVQAGQKLLQGLRAAGKVGQGGVDGCARDEFSPHAAACTKPLVKAYEDEKRKLIGTYTSTLISAYGVAQGKARQCVAMSEGLNAKYAPKAKGLFRYYYEPRLADAAAAGMAGQLTDEAHARCMDIVRIIETSLSTLSEGSAPPPTFDFFHPEY